MPGNARSWSPFATGRRMFIFSSVWTVAGVIGILFTVVGHGSGGYAMIGALCLINAAAGFARGFEQSHRERSDSIR
jgi:hypothetical protein